MPKAKRCSDQNGKLVGWMIFCPGCEREHVVPASWGFDGNYDSPTFKPSLKCDWPYWGDSDQPQCCHSIIEGGVIKFCADSTHRLKGKNVPLPNL
jgi:hypothetical protein